MVSNKKNDSKRMVGIAVFSALAFVVAFVCNIIPPVAGFLSLDVKDAVIAIASFIYGPVSAVIISFIAAFIELITFSTTGWYGFVMNFASSAVFSLTASLIYGRKRNINTALIALASSVLAVTCTMLLLNIFVTPLYLSYIGVPAAAAKGQVAEMLPTVLLPFNFAKALLNSAVAMLLYKPVATALKRIKLASGDPTSLKLDKNTVTFLAIGGAALAVSVAVLVILA